MCGITCPVCPRREEKDSRTLRKDCSLYSKGSLRASCSRHGVVTPFGVALHVAGIRKPLVMFQKSCSFGLEIRYFCSSSIFCSWTLISLCSELDLAVADF